MGRLTNDAIPSISTQWPHHLKYKSKQGPPTTNPCFFWSNSILSICLSNLYRTVKKHEIHTRNQKHKSAFCIVIERNSYGMLNEWPYCLKSLRFGIFVVNQPRGKQNQYENWFLFCQIQGIYSVKQAWMRKMHSVTSPRLYIDGWVCPWLLLPVSTLWPIGESLW